MSSSRQWLRGAEIYMSYVSCLIQPSKTPSQVAMKLPNPSPVAGMTPDEMLLVVEEGRRQIDRQRSDLQNIRTRAQWMLTIMIAASVALTKAIVSTNSDCLWLLILWIAGMLLTTLAILGTTALIVVAAPIGGMNTAQMGGIQGQGIEALADSYTNTTDVGETTLATMLSVLHKAVFLALVGGYASFIAYLAAS